MSSKPNAEASLLDYAEAPLTFNSVDTIPVLNASAAFKTVSGKVFKEDVDIVPVIVGYANSKRSSMTTSFWTMPEWMPGRMP